jgi:hypothetical protein
MNDSRSADAELTDEDLSLLAWLGRVAAVVDPEPPHLRELGRSALSVRRVDSELAELVSDSVLLGGLVRSAVTGPRLLTFVAGDVVIDVQVTDEPHGREVIGQVDGLEPGDVVSLDIETADARVVRVELDELRRFTVHDAPGGLLRLRVVSGPVDVTTAWVRLDSGFRHPTP